MKYNFDISVSWIFAKFRHVGEIYALDNYKEKAADHICCRGCTYRILHGKYRRIESGVNIE